MGSGRSRKTCSALAQCPNIKPPPEQATNKTSATSCQALDSLTVASIPRSKNDSPNSDQQSFHRLRLARTRSASTPCWSWRCRCRLRSIQFHIEGVLSAAMLTQKRVLTVLSTCSCPINEADKQSCRCPRSPVLERSRGRWRDYDGVFGNNELWLHCALVSGRRLFMHGSLRPGPEHRAYAETKQREHHGQPKQECKYGGD